MKTLKDIEILMDKYIKYSTSYYNGKPEISDSEFDKLKMEIEKYREKYDISKIDFIGSNTMGDVFKHKVKMYSLDNVFNIEELKGWMKWDTLYSIEYKYDGISIDLEYRHGGLLRGISRGNGERGTDVSFNIVGVVKVNRGDVGDYNIHGEMVMKYSDFEEANKVRAKDGDVPFISPRNAASAVMMHTGEGKISFIPYRGIGVDITKGIPYRFIGSREEVLKEIESKYKERLDDIPCDGLVISVEDETLIEELGHTSKYPRYKIALKFPNIDVSTTLLDIEWSVGYSGVHTPVAIVEEVEVEDAMVSRVTLNNFKFILDLGLSIGDRVSIIRSGGVIPKLTGVYESSGVKYYFPNECISCKKELKVEGPNLYCKNIKCRGRVISLLNRFVSKDYADVDGVSVRLIEKLYDKGIIDIIKLVKIDKGILDTIEGLGTKSTDSILKGFSGLVGIDMDRFMSSLGIEGLGRKVSKLLSTKIDRVRDILDMDLSSMSGIGLSKELSIKTGIATRLKEIEELEDILKPSKIVECDKSVCFTGKFSKSRKELEEEYKDKGYTITSRVTRGLDLLIVGDKPSSKLVKAKKYGIGIKEM